MEFDLIERIRARVHPRDDVILGIGDDAAILRVPTGRQLVVATDTLNLGVHFPADTAPVPPLTSLPDSFPPWARAVPIDALAL